MGIPPKRRLKGQAEGSRITLQEKKMKGYFELPAKKPEHYVDQVTSTDDYESTSDDNHHLRLNLLH